MGWPPRFEEAEELLVARLRQRLDEPELALARIVSAWAEVA
jgi:hypothetical protein